MTNTPNFASILDEQPTEVKVPPPLPAGTYICVVQGQPEYGKSTQKQTDYVRFNLRPISALEDVDEDELTEIGGFDGKTLRVTHWLTPDAVFMLDQFHEHCGLDLSQPMSRKARNEEVVNAQVLAVVKHSAAKEGPRVYAEVDRTAPVE